LITFSLRQLEYFVAAAEFGSTSKAALALHVSQPSISTAIGHLESVIGEQLFVRRHTQGLALTAAGRRRLSVARELLDRSKSFQHEGASPGDQRGTLDVGCFTTLGPSCMPGILREFRKIYPNVEVRIREGDIEQIIELLDDGILEVAVLYDLAPGSSIIAETVATLELYALLPENHALAGRREVSLTALAREPLILVDLPYSREFLMLPFQSHGLEPRIRMRTSSLEMCRGMVANGHGVALLVTRPCNDTSYDGRRLVTKPIVEPMPQQRVVVARSSRVRPTMLARAFMDCVRAYYC